MKRRLLLALCAALAFSPARADQVTAIAAASFADALQALGIVYATDAAPKGVRVVGTFPEGTNPPISHPFAPTRRGDRPEAQALRAFLTGPEAGPIYRPLDVSVRE